MRNIIAIGSFILLCSCQRNTVPQVTNSVETKDSIAYKTELKDTTIFIPGSVVTIVDTMPCPDWNYDSTTADGSVSMHVNVRNGKLTATCKADSLTKVIYWLQGNVEFYRKRKEVITITKTMKVPKPFIPKWVWWLVAFNVGQLAWKFRFGIAGLVTRVFKRFSKS